MDKKSFDNKTTNSLLCGTKLIWLPHILQFLYVIAFVLTGRGAYVGKVDDFFSIGLFLFFWGIGYLVAYVFMPKFLFKKKYLLYFLILLTLVVLSAILLEYVQRALEIYATEKKQNNFRSTWLGVFFNTTLIYIVFMGPFSFWKMVLQWTKDNNRIHDLENATIQSELQQLKNQVNPHFLFNMLNNANVLIKKDPDKASETLMGLSELLRYQLYESSRPNVLLSGDIKALRDFLDLEKIRRDSFDFSIDVVGDVNAIFVPPLLFIPFVENATKHNLDSEKSSYIHVVFEIQGDFLCFSCVNSKPRVPVYKSSHGGLGLSNSYRRLTLLYDDQYQLNINDEKDTFTVDLKIPIK